MPAAATSIVAPRAIRRLVEVVPPDPEESDAQVQGPQEERLHRQRGEPHADEGEGRTVERMVRLVVHRSDADRTHLVNGVSVGSHWQPSPTALNWMAQLGPWNYAIAFAFMITGLLLTMRWH